MHNSFNTLTTLTVQDKDYRIHSLQAMAAYFDIKHLPFSLKILLENLLRKEDGENVTSDHIQSLCTWQPQGKQTAQIAFTPARVVLQDFTGVPAIVDLAAMRDAMAALGGDPTQINPLEPVDLVIDHSVMVDHFGSSDALQKNTELEFERNRERYQFLRWGQKAFANFRVVPPGTGIVHQVNLEYLGQVVIAKEVAGQTFAYPDTLVGTDSHTTMINGLGILGWGVGGIEAEAAMLGQPVTLVLPEVIGFRLEGCLPEGTTATDLVLTVTQLLRQKGVVGKFVEFYGDGLDHLPLADRATIANMAPEYGATCGIFPIDTETLRYLRLSGRTEDSVALVERYAKVQGLWRESGVNTVQYTDTMILDLGSVVPSIAGPKRPQDRIALRDAKANFLAYLAKTRRADDQLIARSESQFESEGGHTAVGVDADHEVGAVEFELSGAKHLLKHGDVVIAAITSCTNTSNPDVMIAAGLVAQKAVALGMKVKPWVKTSLAPGSQVVPAYLAAAGLIQPLATLGFDVVGFGCTTCIGNSGPLPTPIQNAIRAGDLSVSSVLSGNRNFEGRIHQDVKTNYLASPPLVVAYALAGSMTIDITTQSIGRDGAGNAVYLRDLWPSRKEVTDLVEQVVSSALFSKEYANVFAGAEAWRELSTPEGARYAWPDSTYVKYPPYFEGMTLEPEPLKPITLARCLVKVGDSITTDHISPAGAIAPDSVAGRYLQSLGVPHAEFNSYGSRRGNHEVMVRGTFANIRLCNQLAPGTEGSWTTHFPSGERMTIFDAAQHYQESRVALIVLAGKEYGTGSSRDWAAKGTNLLGVRAVIAESYERIHRSNLVGFGVLPLQFQDGENAESLSLQGDEEFSIGSFEGSGSTVKVDALRQNGSKVSFDVQVRIDTAMEWAYFRHGGILHYVLRELAA